MATQCGKNAEPTRTPRAGLAKPLEALVFLLPLLVFSEIASRYLSSPATLPQQGRVVAFHLLQFFFQLFGSTGALMPALAVVAILLSTHIVSRQPWQVRKSAVALMYVESVALAAPLILVNRWVCLAGGVSAGDWLGESALGVSAGIYEELVFRLVLISVIVMIGSDLLGRSSSIVLPIGILISAVLFAAHHHPPMGGDPFDTGRFLFRVLAGVYLGTIFVVRGYGLAAGAHVAYNLIVLTGLPE